MTNPTIPTWPNVYRVEPWNREVSTWWQVVGPNDFSTEPCAHEDEANEDAAALNATDHASRTDAFLAGVAAERARRTRTFRDDIVWNLPED